MTFCVIFQHCISVAQFLMDLSGEILLGAFPETNYGQKLAQGH